jgi:hypothetical protein
LDLDLLNERSRRFAGALLREFPDWEPYLQVAAHDGVEPGTLLVEVPPPVPGASPLYVDTDAGEITVGFAGWHEHFGAWIGEDEAESTREALAAVRAVVEERLLSVLALDGERWRRSWHVAPGAPVETHHGEQTRVRSWRGTYDADLTRG